MNGILLYKLEAFKFTRIFYMLWNFSGIEHEILPTKIWTARPIFQRPSRILKPVEIKGVGINFG